MNNKKNFKSDLDIIKKKYGENMMHLCRKLFPTILEEDGLLSTLLLTYFMPSRFLYDDIVNMVSLEITGPDLLEYNDSVEFVYLPSLKTNLNNEKIMQLLGYDVNGSYKK